MEPTRKTDFSFMFYMQMKKLTNDNFFFELVEFLQQDWLLY